MMEFGLDDLAYQPPQERIESENQQQPPNINDDFKNIQVENLPEFADESDLYTFFTNLGY
jgi:hypothetical protein